ncbi:FUSC family protein [Corynebacterium sp. TAE3-ERU16]|uniref:FUSC family protein n=1 Tax=Corynebacterium sp. TAE3-ERU16 TaxID=2849493 RepID=UPI001C47EFAE|nr:FUSC family protein [Corynebacterium sp. TAE3-ERU16]MBV7293668.1 FUSC family protein [Corynebacterium sp. TAE3-ERU16]
MARRTSSVPNPAAAVKELLRPGVQRLRLSWVSILQGGIAAGLSWWVAVNLFGHESVFFAPMAAIIVIGLTGGDRLRRAVELNIGVPLGVGIGDLLVTWLGTGTWQMTLIVLLALTVAVLVDKSPLVSTQAAIGVVLIATIFPPGTSGGIDRMLDAFIGGTVGIIVIALIPNSPLRGGRQEIATILTIAGHVLKQVAVDLADGNTKGINAALQEARGTQANINNLIAAAKTGREAATVSPLHWRNRRRVKSLMRILNPVDNAMRNTRVLARRALVLTEDGDDVSARQIAVLEEIADVMTALGDLFDRGERVGTSERIPQLVRRLRVLGAMTGPEVADRKVLSAQMILGQSRSIIVDLLQICGMSRKSAQAALAPTSAHPHVDPEV